MREVELARQEYRRCKYWRQSALHRCSNLEKQLSAARLKGDVGAYLLAQQLADAETAARLAAKDLASAKRVVAMMGG
jgi:hypothetical protein